MRSTQTDNPTTPVLRLSEHALTENGAAITEYIEHWTEQAGAVARHKGWWPQVHNLLNGRPIKFNTGLPRSEVAFLTTVVVGQAVHRIWSRKKIVHSVNPLIVDVLTHSVADTMPGALFGKQPYSDPLVVFPNPPLVSTLYGTPGRLLAFYVVGQRISERNRVLCSTHDEDRSHLLINFVVEVDLPHGEKDLVSTRVRLPVGQGMFTVDDVLDHTLKQFVEDEGLLSEWSEIREVLGNLVRIALGILVYTCTKQPDIIAVPSRARKRRGKKESKNRTPKPVRMARVGWVLGSALDSARRAYERGVIAAQGTGRRQPPHQRRGHMRLF